MMHSRFNTLLSAAALVIAGYLPAMVATSVLAHASGFNSATAEAELVDAINSDRAANGRGPLMVNPVLSSIARGAPHTVCGGATIRGRSQDMIERGYFSHQIPPCGALVWPVLMAYGQRYSAAAENIGWNDSEPGRGVALLNADLMNSPEHRANILGAYNQVGVGAFMAPGSWRGRTGVVMYTEVFTMAPPPSAARPAPRGIDSPGATRRGDPGAVVAPSAPAPAAAVQPAAVGHPASAGTAVSHDGWVRGTLVSWQVRDVGDRDTDDGRAPASPCPGPPAAWAILGRLVGAARLGFGPAGPILACEAPAPDIYLASRSIGSQSGTSAAWDGVR